ncbi:ABC-type cobalamin/Fe3+-siderophore transport system, ATPase component [Lachnospiraceae bacterium JC7]|nr:ABC-type cobalamin/Fe3+-siderophore transport system, ATPase component [Lachnospiraceae bacterium JC7]
MSGKEVIKLNRLSVGYGRKVLIGDIGLSIDEGEIVTLIGPNGAGKSTILKTIARQLEPVVGDVYIEGKPLSKLSFHELSETVSILLTERVDPELMTVRDVVEAGRYPYTGHMGMLQKRDEEVVEEALALCRITDISDRYFRELSDGQKQRVMLARTIAQEPKILVLDEPTSYMDIKYKLELLSLLKRLRDSRKMTILLSLHEFELAKVISDRIICVKDRDIIKVGTPEEILNRKVLCELYDISPENLEILLQSMESVV